MTSCVKHGCSLEDGPKVASSVASGRDGPRPTLLEEPLANVDRYTYEGLITGRATFLGRSVHAGVWFCLLRCLLDELTSSPG
ncbi:hypothetical protein ABZ471_43505 [Streptomyces sp. NPDC005728]|uniref:hypothetical protein n=1 Tax=Streptomyces sp. NPDC005728 TaxID=3157054 RepID=UPI0033DCEB9D